MNACRMRRLGLVLWSLWLVLVAAPLVVDVERDTAQVLVIVAIVVGGSGLALRLLAGRNEPWRRRSLRRPGHRA